MVEQYLDHLARLDDRDLDAWSEFVVIAARLLLIKSRALLPPPRPPAESPPPEEALAEQLRRYRSLRAGMQYLRDREEGGLRSFTRQRQHTVVIERPLARYLPLQLAQAYQRARLRTKDTRAVVEAQVVSVGDKIASIEQALVGNNHVLFDAVLRECRSRTEVVVCFLALLELVKRGIVQAEQSERYGSIVVYPRARTEAAETP